MKRGIMAVLLISFVVVSFTSIVFSQTSKPSKPGSNAIRIGGALPLTGVWADSGKWIRE